MDTRIVLCNLNLGINSGFLSLSLFSLHLIIHSKVNYSKVHSMKSNYAILAVGLATATTTANPISLDPRADTPTTVQGFDISHYQDNVDFAGAYTAGARFVIIKVPLPSPSIYKLPHH